MFADSIILLSVYGSFYLFGGLGNNSRDDIYDLVVLPDRAYLIFNERSR